MVPLDACLTCLQSAYNTWLGKVLSATTGSIGNDDSTLVEFLLDLPELTPDVLLGIRRIAENVDTCVGIISHPCGQLMPRLLVPSLASRHCGTSSTCGLPSEMQHCRYFWT
jgi:hypothetical protein